MASAFCKEKMSWTNLHHPAQTMIRAKELGLEVATQVVSLPFVLMVVTGEAMATNGARGASVPTTWRRNLNRAARIPTVTATASMVILDRPATGALWTGSTSDVAYARFEYIAWSSVVVFFARGTTMFARRGVAFIAVACVRWLSPQV